MSLRVSHLRRSAVVPVLSLLVLGLHGPAQAQLGGLRSSSATTLSCEGQRATIVGTQGGDVIDGTAGNDVIVSLGGNDVIRGLAGDDLICAGAGNDTAYGGPGSDSLDGDGGNDVLRGGPGTDGGLSGGSGNDKLYGETGGRNDLTPGPGDDLVVGSGTGADWVHLEDAKKPIHASLMTGISTGQGTDRLVKVSALLGGPYDDTLIGSNDDDGLVGRAGNDTLIGHGGNDTLSGQQGNDTYLGGPGFDIAEYYDQAAADGLEIGPMNVNLRTGIATGDGTDTLHSIEGATGSNKADTMIGNDKANAFFWLFGGNDNVKGGAGNDYVAPGAGANILSGGPGRDLVSFLGGTGFGHDHSAVTVDLGTGTSSAGDTLSGFEDVFGSVGNDTLIGDNGPNRLYGYTGDDVLAGRAGDDKLIGQGGMDEANGGAGTDRCRAETTKNCETVLLRGASPGVLHPWNNLLATFRLVLRMPNA
jgi:Ca2+-binding RTX toxin-like protein